MAGQVWATDTLGGYMYADRLSEELRMVVQPVVKFRQFADIKDDVHQGKHAGDTVHWNVYSDATTQGTTLVETNTMPTTNYTITQGTMTLNEYGNSVDYTGKLDDLSEHPVREIIHKVLKNDAKKAFDIAAKTQFDASPLRATAASATNTVTITTDGTATEINTVALGKDHVKAIVDAMKERNIPPYAEDDYYAISRPTTLRQMKNDLESIKQYVDLGFQMIMNGEVGRYEGVRFVEQTHIPAGGSAGGGIGTPAGAWAQGNSDWCVFFGDDTVAEAVAVPEEVRGKLPGDFGRDRGIAWYYLGGFGIVHTAQLQARIVIWDSAS